MAKELLKRSEVKVENTWNVEDIFATKQDWEKTMESIKELGDKIATYQGKMGESAQSLCDMFDLYSQMGEKIGRAFSYSARLFDQDQTNSEHQAMYQKMRGLDAKIDSQCSFMRPELLEIPLETLEKFYKEQPKLKVYKNTIDEIQRRREHSLSGEMEKLLSMTSEMGDAPSQTYATLNNADLQFPEMEDENGEVVRITTGRFIQFLESPDRRVRKEAFEKYYQVYKQFSHTMASLYEGHVKSLIFYANARKYPTTLEAAVSSNNVSSQVYDNLLKTIDQNLDKMHRYVKLRKKLLGLEELHMYDIYTPMIAGVAKKVPFEEAKETVLKALAPLGEEYVAKVKEGFDNRWIDVYENEGKRGGAYSAGVYGVHPYVLLNYGENLDSMFTLAHEMGHAMHSHYSNANQPYMDSHYRIFVAEVASTCNEVLLMEYLLKNTTDKKERMYLLNHYLDSFKGTVYRQSMFAQYEKDTNAMAEAGESLTADALCAYYKGLNERYYGPDMISDTEISYEWARIPHFFYNFYVYQYATGFSAAVAIAKGILKNGAPAVEKYKEFLKGGCSKSPVELLKIAGVDMESPAPIQSALDVFGDILTEMEELA